MTSLDQLKDAFAARAGDAPEIADLLAAVDAVPPRAPHRRAAVAAGAVTVAAVSVGGVLVAGRDTGHRDAGRPTAPATSAHRTTAVPAPKGPRATPFVWNFALDRVPGYELTFGQLDPDEQIADVSVTGNDDKSIGDIRVYSRGRFDPSDARRRGTPVTVRGHDGYYARIVDPDTGTTPTDGVRKPAVVWQYAPNAWAIVQGDWQDLIDYGSLGGTAKGHELRIARAVDTSRTTPVRVPFRLTDVPAGLVAENAGTSGDGSQAEIGLTDGGEPDPSMPADTPGNGTAVTVQTAGYAFGPDLRKVNAHGKLHVDRQGGYDLELGRPVSVPGADRAFQSEDGTVTVLYPSGFVTVSYTGAKPARVGAATLLRLARGLDTAKDLTDPDTWFDGRGIVRR